MSNGVLKEPYPLITIGVACYNAEKTILRALNAALSQSWSNFEIVAVDDCSQDNSWSILKEFCSQHDNVRVIRHPKNSGPGTTRNSIVRNARGEFIAFFDDDDVSRPDRLAKQYQRLTNYERANANALVFCFCNRDVVDFGGFEPTMSRLALGRHPVEPRGEDAVNFQLGNVARPGFTWGTIGTCTFFARKSAMEYVGPFETRVRRAEDIDFVVRAGLMGAHFVAVDQPLITQYLVARSYKAGQVELDSKLFVVRKHKDYLQSKGAYAGALAMARAHFWGERGHRARRWLWYLIALAVYPNDWKVMRIKSSRIYRSVMNTPVSLVMF
ncbi:glycosyltransferase family 2 protein [Ovoidimarina sediminis]|uniref:glycosyltransferase family 2 protein n=1 Tax=Ovoidimarina sediminis TaxID=3079856 RepID=UPI00290BD3B5|nr:glycosyltransferase family 2 protein [Rhodophyticola sp. MJ-SS7]MDU8945524.1 glycosyltransferase family 2 protein [Rhodophyticola sp. MJ-SS7]